MREGLERAVKAAPDGYVELRLRHRWVTTLVFRRQRLEVATQYETLGGVARCLAPGHGWGAVAFTDGDRAVAAVERAYELSLETHPTTPIALAAIPIRQIEQAEPLVDDPRTVPLKAKRGLLEQLTGELLGADRRVVDARTSYVDAVHETWLATSEGAWLHDLRSETSLSALAVASEDGSEERAIESVAIPGGWGAIRPHGAIFRAAALGAVGRLHAMPVRPGRYPVVLDPRASGALVLQAISSHCRAPVRGAERELLAVGTRIGPECLSVGDDPTAAGLRTSLWLDDEATPVSHTMLVRHGVVVGHLHTRETAARASAAPTGHALAPALRSVPIARPTNTYLAKGQGDLGQILAGIPLGIYLTDVQGITEEAQRLSLTPGAARMIRQGELAEPIKCPPIVADLYSWFGRLEAVGGDFVWDSSLAATHEPGPNRSVTTGAPHTRFVDLDIAPMYA
jgi:TldD protein